MSNVRVISSLEGPRSRDRSADATIVGLAAAQHGRVARRQLLAAGVTARQIAGRLASGLLIVEFTGVYAVGHRTDGWLGRLMAATLAAGDNAALSHTSGAAHRGIIRWRPTTIHLTCPRALRSRPPIRFHRSPLPPDEVEVVDCIPTTSVARTLLDLAGVLSPARLALAINEAEVKELTGPLSLPALIERHPRRPGARAIAEILESGRLGSGTTESELEDLFQILVAEERLQQPLTNAMIDLPSGPIVVDCLWLPQRVVLELDGERFHGTVSRRRQDLARDRALTAAGYRPMRAGWRDIVKDRRRLAGDLRRVLSASSGS